MGFFSTRARVETPGVLRIDPTADVGAMSNAEIACLLDKADAIADLLTRVRGEGERRARAGTEIEGFKLVKGRAARAWKEGWTDAVATTFGEAAYETPPKKLKGLTAIKQLPGGEAFVAEWTYIPDAGLAFVPVSDKRPRVQVAGSKVA